jgi:hypothetical protein
MTREPLHADRPVIVDTQIPAARNVHIHLHAGRRAPRTHPRHQPVAPTVSGSVRAKSLVLPANHMPRVAGRRPIRLSVAR